MLYLCLRIMLFTIYVYPMCIIRRLIKLLMPVLWRSMSLLFTFAYSLLNYSDTCRTDDEEHTGHNHHVALCAAYKREDHAAKCCRYDLRDAYRAVEQTEVGTHVAAVEGVGDDGERHGQHCSPGTSYQKIRNKENILVADVRNHQEAYAA